MTALKPTPPRRPRRKLCSTAFARAIQTDAHRRWRHNGGAEDLHKARHYLDKLIELECRT